MVRRWFFSVSVLLGYILPISGVPAVCDASGAKCTTGSFPEQASPLDEIPEEEDELSQQHVLLLQSKQGLHHAEGIQQRQQQQQQQQQQESVEARNVAVEAADADVGSDMAETLRILRMEVEQLREQLAASRAETARTHAKLKGTQGSLIGSLQGHRAGRARAAVDGIAAWKASWPQPPPRATSFNGIQWPTLSFSGPGPEHVFSIGDWGGIMPKPKPAPNQRNKHRWGAVLPHIDYYAQHLVAKEMIKKAVDSNPRYILNGGDNFYWGGLESHCGNANETTGITFGPDTNQFQRVWKDMYKNLAELPWLSVLGNHDYGGYTFYHAWDQQIAYTWVDNSWVMPAQYWAQRVDYPDQNFSIDYFFLDTNRFDAHTPSEDPMHNICSREHNKPWIGCPDTGPADVDDCFQWFKDLWSEQLDWLRRKLIKSTADWRIIVTHFPPEPYWGQRTWEPILSKGKVDLFIASHRHQQELHSESSYRFGKIHTAVLVGGGGGGVTSEFLPSGWHERDQYGFFDLTIQKETIFVQAWDHWGRGLGDMVVHRKDKSGPAPNMTDLGERTLTDEELDELEEDARDYVEPNMENAPHEELDW